MSSENKIYDDGMERFLRNFVSDGYRIKVLQGFNEENAKLVKVFKNGFAPLYLSFVPELNGKKRFSLVKVSDGSIIERFMHIKNPPKENDDIICPSFLELKWAYGCPFNCAYCYLQGTLRLLPTKKKPSFKNVMKVRKHLISLLMAPFNEPEILNSGELCDSLMYEKTECSITRNIIPLFEDTTINRAGHKVLLVTKSDNIEEVENSNPKHVVVSFSINSSKVFKKWEKGTAHPISRIKAAKELSSKGFEIRVRLDPIVPFPKTSWKKDYFKLIDKIFNSFLPSRFTIGSLRGLATTIKETKDKSWTYFLKSQSKWGLRLDYKIRLKTYETVINYLYDEYNYTAVALCKETAQMWQDLKLKWNECACNCTW